MNEFVVVLTPDGSSIPGLMLAAATRVLAGAPWPAYAASLRRRAVGGMLRAGVHRAGPSLIEPTLQQSGADSTKV